MKMGQFLSKNCQCQNFNLRHRSILWSHDVPVLWSGPIAGKKLGTRLPLLLLVGQRKWKRGGNKRGQAGNKKRSGVGSAEILPHGTVPKNWSDPRSDAISDDLDSTGIELGCRRILNFEKWFGNGGDLPRGDMSPENHNFPGNLFLESRTLLFLASSEVSFGYAPLYILSDCLSVLCVIPWYWCGNR